MSDIYADFEKDMDWIRGEFRRDLSEVPESLHEMSSLYLTERVLILPKRTYSTHPKYGTPMPYVVFWFADALGLKEKDKVNKLALSLMYANTFYCIRDDLIDGRIRINGRVPDEHEHIALANFFFAKYLEIFRGLFSPKSTFWSYLVNSIDNWWQHEYWSFFCGERKGTSSKPLSQKYLANSSRYIVGVTAPSIIAIALLTGNEKRINQIQRFLTSYFMGYRIADDLRDWMEDLRVKHYNRSTVIHLAIELRGTREEIDEKSMTGFLLNDKFRNKIYGAIRKKYNDAKREASDLHSSYLDEFIDNQLSYFEEENNYFLELNRTFEHSIRNVLQSVIDSNARHPKTQIR